MVYNPPNIMAVSAVVPGDEMATAAANEVERIAAEAGQGRRPPSSPRRSRATRRRH